MANPRVLRIAFVSAITALLLLAPVTASAQATSNPRVLPPNSMTYGKTYGGWAAAWWQWVLAQPDATNPLNDATGANCQRAQSGPVFFLVGHNNTGSDTRDQCVVPSGKALFFPLVNIFDAHVECTPETQNSGFCDGNETPKAVWEELEVTAGGTGYQINSLFASIDGGNVNGLRPAATSPYRVCNGLGSADAATPTLHCSGGFFSVTFPADGLFVGLPAGTYGPTAADGAYLMLAPLAPGKHSLQFGGDAGFGGVPNVQSIVYNLTVAP